PVGRYLSVANQPLPAQVDVFNQTLQVNFPESVTTVHGAIEYLLRFSGYALMPLSQQSHAVQRMLQSSLPEVDRHLGPIPLRQGLTVLVGEPFQLLMDPVHRLVAFRLKPVYVNRYTEEKSP